MIVRFPVGGAADVIGRIIAERMREPLGQPIITENIGGADGSSGVRRTACAGPDGYTICLGIDGAFVGNGAVYALPCDVFNDFAPISPLAAGSIVLVAGKTLPAKHLGELIAWLKVHPNQASAGMNTLSFRLLAMRFEGQTGTQFNIIPHRAVGAVIGDWWLAMSSGTLTTHLPQLRAGSERAYAVAGKTRWALAPDIPTFAEIGLPTLTCSSWYGVFAPRDTPKRYYRQAQCGHRPGLGRSGCAVSNCRSWV
jgi:tripartite-type tricarboxylate transporter receptor subunit TctC